MSDTLVSVHHISKTFGGAKALDDVDFDLLKGEVHCLIGPNGCGKSTLIKIIAGVMLPDSGEPVRIKGVSVIYQDLSLFPNLTVEENIWFPLYNEKRFGMDRKQYRRRALASMEEMGLTLDPSTPVSSLSIADRQLVAIARALVNDSSIVFMDEPTSSLTKKEVDTLFTIVRRLKEAGKGIVFVSHKLDEIIRIADRITVMRDGQVLKSVGKEEVDEKSLSVLISGETQKDRQTRIGKTFEPLLQVRGLSKQKTYEDVSFDLGAGEVLGIIGSIGAGRTEVALSIFGLVKPDAGSVVIGGKPLKGGNCREAMEAGIAYVPEDRIGQGVAIDQNVEVNITATTIKDFKIRGLLSREKTGQFTAYWIDKLNIRSARRDLLVSALSGGNQQKVVLAKWLAIGPRVLIMDEPTNGIDVGAKHGIYERIRELADEGIGVILISDEPQEIYNNCDRVLLMEEGRIKKTISISNTTYAEFSESIQYV